MRRRSNLLVLLGLASFVLGLIAVYLITGDDDDGGGGSDRVAVLVAREDVPAGTLGDEAVASGAVEVVQVDVEDKLADALSSASQISGTRFTQLFPAGEQIRSGGVATLGGPQAQIPEGFEAVALELDFVAGGANTIAPNDRVNIFQLVTNQTATIDDEGNLIAAGGGETAKLLLTNVLVLDVQRGTPNLAISATQTDPATGAVTNPGTLIVVVAVNAVDAEKVIFGSVESEADPYRSIYLSRVRLDDDGNPPPPAVGDPEGRSLENILAQSAAEAFAESNPTP